MTATPLTQRSERDDRITEAQAIAPLSHAEAGALARVELQRFLDLVASLDPADWERPTMCGEWSVRQMLAHQVGAYASGASLAEFLHQWIQRPQAGREMIDVVNALQIRERSHLTPAELIAALREVGPRAISARQRLPWPVRRLPIPIPPLGLRSLGYLTDALYLRDTWSHRLDISRATDRPLLLSPEHDGRVTALIVRDLAPRLGRRLGGAALLFDLSGPAGGRFRIGPTAEPAATIAMDAVDFHLRASARLTAEQALARAQVSGDVALAARALEYTFVVY